GVKTSRSVPVRLILSDPISEISSEPALKPRESEAGKWLVASSSGKLGTIGFEPSGRSFSGAPVPAPVPSNWESLCVRRSDDTDALSTSARLVLVIMPQCIFREISHSSHWQGVLRPGRNPLEAYVVLSGLPFASASTGRRRP